MPSLIRLSYSRALTALRRGKRVCWGFLWPSAVSRQHYTGPLLLPGSTPDNHNARYGASEYQPVQTPICSKIVPRQVQFLIKEVAAGTLVPRLLGQSLCLKLVANSAEPRQGFVFAKNVLGTQPVWVCTSLPTPRLHSYQGFLCPSAVAVTTVPSRGCHSSQVFSTGPPERAASPASQYQ